MCGIAGFIGLDPTSHDLNTVLGAMLDRIVHRGPDDSGTWLDGAGGFGFGMRRLSIVDLAGGHQPIWNEGGSVGVVFNGEIYNHAALRNELVAKGHVFTTHSDTEVLVHLYEEHGTDLLGRLRGMYALAILDRGRRSLLLARDPFGQKPLHCFSPRRGVTAFASEIKSLAAFPGWSGRTDGECYLDYAMWLCLPARSTHWRDVEKLGPGEWRLLDIDNGASLREGRTPAIHFEGASELHGQEATDVLLHALEDSVRHHLAADVPVGLMLSGGSDSLAVGWVTSRVTDARLHTFTAGFTGENNEFEPARRTAALLNSHHHEIVLEENLLAHEVGRVIRHLDEPIGDPAAVAVLRICEEARRHVKVLLGGEGSDELFAGYAGRYAGAVSTLRRSAWLRRTLGLLPGGFAGDADSRLGRAWNRSRLSREAELLVLRAEGIQPGHKWLMARCPDVAPRLWDRVASHAARLVLPDDTLDAVQRLDMDWQLAESLLVKADRMSMAASVELRCPFLDQAVAGVAGRLPARLRLSPDGKVGKLALRRLIERYLPREAARPKIGFALPLGRWLRGPLADDVESHLTADDSMFVRTFGREAAREWWNGFLAGELSPHTTYALWIYERWLRQQPAAMRGP